jgi:hypothetical protein
MIIPTIDKRGSLGEVVVPKRDSYYVKSTLGNLPFSTSDEDDIVTVPVQEEVFGLATFYFRVPWLDDEGVGDRTVVAWVYISTDFLPQYQPGARQAAINDWVHKRAAWFFSYGQREDVPT